MKRVPFVSIIIENKEGGAPEVVAARTLAKETGLKIYLTIGYGFDAFLDEYFQIHER